VRVIAGTLRGRTLFAPPGAATRPTADRVREALFSILGDVSGARVLDLYAGTGALGIEALSRGAARATFVEHARPALRVLRRNVQTLGLETLATVLSLRAERALSTRPWGSSLFDLVFIDPPYDEVRRRPAAGGVARMVAGDLSPSVELGGRVVLEHASSDLPPEIAGFEREDTRTYGDTTLSFYIR